MTSYGVCADCGAGLKSDSGLCFECSRRIMKELNTPSMDKAVSVFIVVLFGALVWMLL